MTKRVIAALVVSLAMPVAAAAAPETTAVTRHVLPNGMTVLIRESRVARVVAASLQVAAGSVSETRETAGITSFVHRVMVRGTGRHSATQLAEAAEDLGGSVSGSSDAEHAEIHGRALAQHWDALLTLMADVAISPAFREDEIERVRRLMLADIQARADRPLASAMDALMRDLYGRHPYGLPLAGTRDSIAAMSRQALVAQYQRIYRPDRMVLAVSGDVIRGDVLKRVERLFGRLERTPLDPAPEPEPPIPTRQRRVIEQPARQAQVVVGYLTPAFGDADYAASKVLAAVLGSGTSGRIFRELRERQGLAYALGVSNPSRRGPAAFVAHIGTEAPNIAAAEAGIRTEIDRARAEPPTADELERAKAYILGTLAMDRRTNSRQAWYLAFYELIGVGWDFPSRYAASIEAVTADAVLAAARRYLTSPTSVVLTPKAR